MLAALFGALVGVALGLTGGGGSILAVPLLLFGLGMELREAVVVSLAVVGLTALYGAVIQSRNAGVLWGAGGVLGVGGVLLAPLGAKVGRLLPDSVTLLLFAALMAAIGLRMLLAGQSAATEVPFAALRCERGPAGLPKFSTSCAAKLLTAGGVAGFLSGIFGVGGGFILVPVLLVVTGIDLGRALATSLVAIFLISIAGLASNLWLAPSSPNLTVALLFLLGSACGMTAGALLKPRIPPLALRKIFAAVVILMGALVAAGTLLPG